ncbi:MAG: acetylxylan esterase [Bacteroidales bacterium]|nr:acetylxylan esterase [Bacteroidales bacterium]
MRKTILTFLIIIVFTNKITFPQNSPAPIKLIQFVLTPDHSNWNYKLNEEATIKILVTKFGIPVSNAEIEYEFGPEMLAPEKKDVLILKEGAGEINIGTTNKPGFRQLKVKIKTDGYEYKDEIKVAFEPTKIQPTIILPQDFDKYWQDALEANSKVPMDAIVTYKPEYSTATVNVYLVSLQNYKIGKRLYGYLCKPKAPGKYPVLLLPPGAGIKKIDSGTFYADEGFISLSIEIHGISPELSEEDYNTIRFAFGDYWLDKLDDKDNYYYISVYVGCIRAIDFLTSLPEFDGKNVAVTGGSQGGALSIVTAALDRRVTCLAAFYPALCDLTGYLNGRAGGWPHIFSDRYKEINATPEKINTAAYYDVANFARKITVPGFYSFGYNDHTCPPTSILSALNVITAPKEVVITPISGHWRFNETNDKSVQWLKEKCGIK